MFPSTYSFPNQQFPPILNLSTLTETIHSAVGNRKLAKMAIRCLPTDGQDNGLARASRVLVEQTKALSFAAKKLQQKRRGKDQEPAFLHSFRVALILSGLFGVEEASIIQTGLLHDVLEDSDTEYEELEEGFGESVADNVVLLTKPRFFPKALRRQVYEDGIIAAREDVILVKLADLYDNLQNRKDSPRVHRTWATASRLMVRAAHRCTDQRSHCGLSLVHQLMCEIAAKRPHLSVLPYESLTADSQAAIAA